MLEGLTLTLSQLYVANRFVYRRPERASLSLRIQDIPWSSGDMTTRLFSIKLSPFTSDLQLHHHDNQQRPSIIHREIWDGPLTGLPF